MAKKRSLGLAVASLLLSSLGGALGSAQNTASPSRLAGDWRSSAPVILASTRAPLSATGADQGAAPANLALGRMLLLLQSSPAQQQALTAELTALQDPSSPQYHQWLSPATFADAYANSAGDVAAVAAWLRSQGFQVAPLPAGRGWIEFSGTVAQAEQAFQAQIHMMAGAAGSARPVLMGPISVPAALQPVVAGPISLDGTIAIPALTAPIAVNATPADLAAVTTPSAAEALTPKLEAQLLDLAPLAKQGITGAGQTVAIATRSNVNAADVAAFRSTFGLPASPVSVLLNGPDPGLTDAQAEATLSASWVGAIAPGAQIVVAPAASTSATDGVDLSLAAIVDQHLASTAAIGFSSCEAGMSAPHQAFYAALYRQAAAEGIAIVAAAGDSGAAACAAPGGTLVSSGYGVNAMASTAWDTAAGVAGLSTSSSGLSAWSPRNPADPAYAGGGGGSAVYGTPGWQPAPTRLPAGFRGAATRLVPDLSLPTAIDSGANPGLAFCLSNANAGTGCTSMRSGGSGAAASLFAGMAALRDQQYGPQGNLAAMLYQLSNSGAGARLFQDVAQGNTQLKCAAGSPGCGADGQIGFAAAAGYDLATGLGVPDATQFATIQPMVTGTSAVTVVNTTTPGQTINPSGSVDLSAVVTSGTGGAAPTGTVTFFDQSTGGNIVTVALSGVTANSSSASQTVTGALAQGSHSIVAQYSGDSSYAAASSSAVVVNAQPSSTTTSATPADNSPSGGSSLVVTAVVTSANAGSGALAPSGTVVFKLDGVSQGSSRLLAGLASGATTDSSTSITITVPYSAGAHQIVGVYSGDTNYTTSTSSAATINVGTSTPTVTLTPSTTTPGAGGSVILSVTIAAPGSGSGATAPTGTVNFTLDGALVGTQTVNPGSPATATLTLNGLTLGTHTVQAVYSGDTNYNAASSLQVTLNVGKMATTLAVSPATTTPAANSSLLVTATLTPAGASANTPSGTVTFTLDGATVGTASLIGGNTATANITVPASGAHTLAASYSGDANFAASTAAGVGITVAKTTTTTVATPVSTTPALGSSVSINTTVTPSSYGGTDPTGTIAYVLDGITAETIPVVPGSPSTASAPLTMNTAGTHTLVAIYSGDSLYATSTSAPVTLTVAKLTTTTAITPSTTTPSAGTSMQATALVSTTGSSTTTPSGNVSFTIDGVNVATIAVTGTSPAMATATFTVPAAGTHALQATYAGDVNYSSSTSTSVTLNVSKSTPTILVAPASTTPAAGSSLQLTAQISPPASGATAPSGTVIFSVDGTPVGTALVNGGSPATATVTITAPGVGAHIITAAYSGDGNYTAVTSSAVTINVSKGNTTLTVAPTSQTPIANSTMLVTATLTATVTGTTIPTGTVSFSLDGMPVGSGTLNGGTSASITIAVPASGTHTLQASYSGDTNFNASVSPAVTFTVAKTTTTTVVTPATTTPATGATIPVTATVTAGVTGTTQPTGTVTFTIDGVTQGIQVLSPGSPSTAHYTLPALTPGAHTLQATYSGDVYYAASTSAGVTITLPKGITSMTVAPATTTPTGGSPLAVSATITAATTGSTLPTGTVSFTLDGASVETSQVVSGTPSTATATIPSVPGGTHVLAATYSGDTVYAAATAPPVTLTVAKSPTTMTIMPSTLIPTAGSSLGVVVDVASANLSATGPTGVVTVTMDGVAVATGNLTAGSPSTANITIPVVAAGAHILAATYAGDTNFTSSAAAGVTITAGKGATVTTVAATPATLTSGTAESLTATIAPVNAVIGTTYTFTGSVTFYDGTKLLGLVPVAGSTATLAGLTMAANISHSITAVYSGDGNWLGSTSAILPLAATTLPDVVVLTANSTNPGPGQAIVLTVTVTPTTTPAATAEQNPTGTVVFYNGTTVIGTSTLVGEPNTYSSIATLTTQTLPGGAVTLSAYYQGDLAYDAALSNTLSLTVQAFTITPAPTNPATNLDIVQGGAGSVSFNVTGVGGFTGMIQAECQVPSQDYMTCTASPQQLTPPGTLTFAVQTFTSGQPATASRGTPPLWPRAAGGAALAGLLFLLLPFGRRARTFLHAGQRRALIVLLLLAGLVGTGVGCTSGGALTSYGTPLGVATLQVTAQAYVDNAAVSQSVYFTVNVLAR